MCYGVLPSPLTSLRVKPRPNKSNVNATHRNILGCNMLRPSGRPVAPCCDMLVIVGSKLIILSQRHPTYHNRVAKRTQHVAPKHFALKCCDRLAGALEVRSLTGCVLHAFRMYLFVRFPQFPPWYQFPYGVYSPDQRQTSIPTKNFLLCINLQAISKPKVF